jgi:cyclic pyranopterin monophosphate synthase
MVELGDDASGDRLEQSAQELARVRRCVVDLAPRDRRHRVDFGRDGPEVSMQSMESALTHLDAAGNARMVDVSSKTETVRWARARAVVRMSPEAAARVAAGDAPKGDVATVARLAAIQAAKRTDELIPLAHSLPLTQVEPSVHVDPGAGTVTLVAEARTSARTGVEMEAMVACSVGALAVYDMVKGIEPGVVIEQVELLDKTGGKSDYHRA